MSPDAATVAAVDLGATSGRVVLGRVDGSGIALEEVARFPTGAVRRPDGWHWDFGRIVASVTAGLDEAAQRAMRDDAGLASAGVDSWAVDYGLVRDGELLAEPFHYRDERTAVAVESVREHISDADLFARNGLQFLPFNSIYQLDADRADGTLAAADRVLLIPDLVGSILTGQAVAERTNASTTGLLNATSLRWDDELIELLGLGRSRFAPLVDPGAEIGAIRAPGSAAAGTPLVTVGSHDTASAVAGVPGAEGGFAYVSCGTWGLVGLELEHPVLNETARLARFTNELGVDARVRFLHNVMGLWLLDECVKQWADADGAAVDLPALLARAEAGAGDVPLFDADDPVFLPPGDMVGRLTGWFADRGLQAPEGRVELTRSIVESLAQTFADTLERAAELAGRDVAEVHVVGGGTRNLPLCRALARRSGRTVLVGPSEATALGNVLVQARAAGALSGDIDALRAFAGSSMPPQIIRPDGAVH